jgi:hypothetical protein
MSANYPKDLAKHVHSVLNSAARTFLPPLHTLEELFEHLYFASLQQEEAENVTCRVAFIDRQNLEQAEHPKNVWRFYPLSPDIAFTTRNLTKLSKGADPWASTLAVGVNAKGDLRIWGLFDQTVHENTFIFQETHKGITAPGMFQSSVEGVGEIAAFNGNIFLGRLRQNVMATKELAVLDYGPIHQKLSQSIRGHKAGVSHSDSSLERRWLSTLSRILIGIRRYRHGGAVLLSDNPRGLEVRYNLQYARLSEALDRVTSLYRRSDSMHSRIWGSKRRSLPMSLYLDESILESDIRQTENEITGCVRFLSSLSRVDGLLWFKRNLTLQGFGVLVQGTSGPQMVFRANNAHSTDLTEIDVQNFGTRHRSMMRYCSQNADAVGFVVSQDGDVRAITSQNEKVILWESIRLQRLLNMKSALRSGSDEDSSE